MLLNDLIRKATGDRDVYNEEIEAKEKAKEKEAEEKKKKLLLEALNEFASKKNDVPPAGPVEPPKPITPTPLTEKTPETPQQPAPQPATPVAPVLPHTKPRLGRTVPLQARFTPREAEQIRARAQRCNLTQGDYIREMLLRGEIHVTQGSACDEIALASLAALRADLGRIGGLLVQMRTCDYADDTLALELSFEIQQLKTRISRLEVQLHAHQA